MKFTSYNTIDEMFKDLVEAREEADARVQPWQVEIKPGDLYMENTEYGFQIFGKILKSEGEGSKFYQEPHMKNYRLVKAFSVACPEGEMGDVHVSSITRKLSQWEFELAKDFKWNIRLPRHSTSREVLEEILDNAGGH